MGVLGAQRDAVLFCLAHVCLVVVVVVVEDEEGDLEVFSFVARVDM